MITPKYEWINHDMIRRTDPDDGVYIIEEHHPDWGEAKGGAGLRPAPMPPHEEPTLEEQRATWSCSRAQGKLAIGPEVWANVVAMADDPETPWGLKVAIYDTYEWRRLDPNMDVLIWAMGLTDEQADDLFRLAMTL